MREVQYLCSFRLNLLRNRNNKKKRSLLNRAEVMQRTKIRRNKGGCKIKNIFVLPERDLDGNKEPYSIRETKANEAKD